VVKTFQGLMTCSAYRRTWAFPAEVEELLRAETAGLSVLHLFGGQAGWGVRLDSDPATRPQVVGNAFFPPFKCESFDVVLCDPPYKSSNGLYAYCLVPAACLARRRVWWFSTDALAAWYHGLRLLRWWAVMPSSHGPLRYLAEFDRTRHPRSCYPRPGKGARSLPAAIRPYDWRSRIEQPTLL